MHYLITGGSGFIGRYFCELLRSRGDTFTILDLAAPDFDSGATRVVVGDVRDPAKVKDAIQGAQRVLHLAAAHHDFGIEHDTYYDVNQNGSRVLCDAMDAASITDVTFFSSVAVYGEAPEPHTEDAPKDPKHPYGGSKLAGEKVFEAWLAKGGSRRVLVIRPTITFGPRNFANMYSLIRQVDSGKFANVGAGDNVKSLSYVENIVRAAMFLWDTPNRPALDVYNFVEKPDLTSRQIAETINTSLGRKKGLLNIPMWFALLCATPFDIVIKLTGKNLPVSSMRVKKLFATQTKFEASKLLNAGWKSPVPLPEGLNRMVKWYLSEGKGKPAVWRTPPAKVGGNIGYAKMGGKADVASEE